jgi:hypothetical protein
MAITVKHKFVSAIPDGTDATIVRPSNWNDDHDLTGTISVANGGTGASTAADGLNNLLPSQTGNNGKVLATDGTNATWTTNGSGDVVGPASSTNNAIARFDSTTGKLIKNSGVTVDNNNNINANALDDAYTNTAASGTLITLTVASPRRYTITGSGGQVIKLPDATTLTNGTVFQFDNNQSSGAITVNNNSNTLIVSVPSGGFVLVNLLSNAIAAGSWDRHDQAPSNVSWSTNTFDYAGSITSATWNGNTVAVNRGGTGVTTSTGSGSNVLNTSPTLTTPAITGGTIDNTVIGGTTPAAGTFTTITGQTEVLKGTGQNLILRSQNFGTTWTNASVTITANSTTAPDATNTASTIAASSTGTNRRVWQGFTSYSGLTYTASFYAKPLTTSWVYIQISDNTANANGYYFDVTNGVVGTNTGLSAGTGVTLVSSSITSAGNGWYRCSVTVSFSVSASFSTNNGVVDANSSATATSGASAYFWGAQVEVGTTANTYIPTTTTAVYGTPTLSFSGVAGLGLESNGSLYVSPAGTGALQAQATTSTTVGGNARGANAVDWQTSRSAATNVASALYSVICGGSSNLASQGSSLVVGGANNASYNYFSSVVGGQYNGSSGVFGSIVNGYGNNSNGYFNFIGNGQSNSGGSASAVTTQSSTMNGTTAVTLSGSNANIKVGQLIVGTYIGNYTYVAAVSGTSLTLSQVASGSGTATLSFYTPHGVVVGGGNNQATGSYSFIGGGGDAGTAANRNVASGDWSFVGGGTKNSATNSYSSVLGGQNNSITTNHAFIGGGINNSASNSYASVVGGYQNSASGSNSVVTGGTFGTTRSITGFQTFTGNDNALGSGATGTIQAGLLVLGKVTTDATATVLTSSNSAASGTNQVILPNNSAYFFTGEVISGVTGGGDTKGWTIEGVIKRGAGVGTTALVGSTVTSLYADAGAATWTIALAADTTNGGLRVTFTGQASTTIRTVCQIRTTEMTY